MKVLHYEHNGVGVILSQALQKLGVESRVLSSAIHPFGFKEDFLFPRHLRPWRAFFRRFEWKKFYDFDILHSHDSHPLPSYVLRRWRGRLIQHYYDPEVIGPMYPSDVPSFVPLPSILKAVPNATWLPIPAETDVFTPEKRLRHDGVRVGYSGQQIDPTKQRFIPNREIQAALEKLGGRAKAFPLVNIVPHDQMPEYYGQIDIWVDRIGLGFYGFAAIEAAAMGVPVVTQIGQNEAAFVPSCPFISVGRTGVTDAVISLAEDEQLRQTLGRKAREYVVTVHDSITLARQCLNEYERVLEGV